MHATDYEAIFQHTGWGKWKVVVHVDEAFGRKYVERVRASYSHRIVSFESLDSESAKLDKYSYGFISIGALFDDVADILDCQENSCRDREFFTPYRWVVEFDPVMGYPRFISNTYEGDPGFTRETKLVELKILARGN